MDFIFSCMWIAFKAWFGFCLWVAFVVLAFAIIGGIFSYILHAIESRKNI